MSPKQIKQLVDDAIALDRKIATLTADLNAMKAELTRFAEDKSIEKTKTECGGWSAVLLSSAGDISRVTKPADKLKNGVDAESDEWGQLKEILGPVRLILFTKVTTTTYVPAKSIRENLVALGAVTKRRVLKLITSKSKSTVSFETKEAS